MKDSLLQRLADLVAAPSRLMDHVAETPRILAPGLMVLVVMGALTYLTLPISGPESLETMRDSKLYQMLPEGAWEQQYEAALNPEPRELAIKSVSSGLVSWGSILLFGLVLGFFVRMSGGQGTMKQAMGVVSWGSLLPFGLGALIKLPVVLVTESATKVSIGLAAFASGGDPSSALFKFLQAYGDFFTWWGLVVLIIGFSRVFKVERSVAAVAVILPWALITAVMVVPQMIFM